MFRLNSGIRRPSVVVALASAFVLAMGGLAHAADEVVDNVDAVQGNAPGRIDLTATGTSIVKYKIVADGTCDATSSTPASVALSADPATGLGISPSTLTFTSCNTEQSVTYTGANTTAVAVTHSVTAVGTIPLASPNSNRNLSEQDARLTVVVAAAPDTDGDGIADGADNCPNVANADQADTDGNGIGDACDAAPPAPDGDLDGVADAVDNCPAVANASQDDLDGDGVGDACDPDTDGDGVLNGADNCPVDVNADQADLDDDGLGDACDPDLDGDGVLNAVDNCPLVSNADQANADSTGVGSDNLGDACDPNSFAPEVGQLAGDANGNEGTPGNPSTSGSFTDRDDPVGTSTSSLTLSIGATDAGTFTDNLDGTFSWSHTTTDDATGTVTVTASDGEHADATQTFSWTAANVAPVIGAVTATPIGACTVSLSAAFTDQGSGDTHSASIDWGDGSSSTFTDPETSPVAGSHTYTSNGTKTIGVTVTDDDTGSDTESSAASFDTKNTPSAIMQPINAAGTRSVFKLGSTIPVKITVTGCDGLAVTNLTPTVGLSRLDSLPDGYVNETAVSTSAPTSGTTMRWSDTQYIYNLSTKNSQLSGGGALPSGTYKVTVSDASFYAPTSAVFDLRK